ncbi:MAG: hypothetical protein KBD66_03835 [Candidatus Doudnabacteria bacterium]|nr:hypothetical protein [Candidatus Doudnabacteria bacterium]
METFIPQAERVTGSYLENPRIMAVIESQRAKMGDLTPTDVKAALRDACFPGENPAV